MRRSLLTIIAVLFVLVTTNVAQDGGSTQRLNFPRGKTSTQVKGAVDLMNPDAYVLPLSAGQRLTVKLKGTGVFVRLLSPTTRIEVADSQRLDQRVQESGNYTIVVHCISRKSLESDGYLPHRYTVDVKVR